MGKYRRIFTNEHDFIIDTDIKRLTDPTPLAAGEHDFGGFFPNSNNPLRLGENARTPTYLVPTEVPVYDDEGVPTGEMETKDIPHHYEWLDCKIDGQDVVPMTDADKALRDADKAAEEAEKDAERQAAKSAALKVAENNFIFVCDAARQAVGQEATQTKLGMEDLQTLIEQIKVADFNAATELSLKSLATIHEVEVHGGTWDDVEWHEVA